MDSPWVAGVKIAERKLKNDTEYGEDFQGQLLYG
jgi:hypothetical protein